MLAKIYVPDGSDTYLDGIAEIFVKLFGGCTITPNCKGLWKNDKNQVITDKISIIEAYSSMPKNEAHKNLTNIALTIKKLYNQASVAYCVDNDIYFV